MRRTALLTVSLAALATLLPAHASRATLADRVRAILAEGLHRGDLSAAHVARRLSMSERSVRRGLAALVNRRLRRSARFASQCFN